MSIEDRLRKIITTCPLPMEHYEGTDFELTDIEIAAIKQAFEDEGYIHFAQIANGNEIAMAGQEWFTAFERELSGLRGVVAEDEFEDILEAAKRASGVDK